MHILKNYTYRKRIHSLLSFFLFILASICIWGGYSLTSFAAYSWNYNYTGAVQTWTCPANGWYKLETWGAQGGNSVLQNTGGRGGYACGYKYLAQGTILYIAVGGQGESVADVPSGGTKTHINNSTKKGGWNGGGTGGAGLINELGYYYGAGSGGGGATHIATTNRGVLANYTNNRNEVLLVAGGGGGSAMGWYNNDGFGGGETGGSVTAENNSVKGGTQTTGYAFGQGAPGDTGDPYGDDKTEKKPGGNYGSVEGRGGSGGGWYGGERCTNHTCESGTNIGGAGGSGHLGDVEDGSMQSGVREGNGFARISNNWVNISVLCPDKHEHLSGQNITGYFRYSVDNVNWSSKVLDQGRSGAIDTYKPGQKIYIQWLGSPKNYFELVDMRATYDDPVEMINSTDYYHAKAGDLLPKVNDNTWVYTVIATTKDDSKSFSQCIHINVDYKHTTLTLDPNGGTINGNASSQALSPKMQYSTSSWNDLSTKTPTRNGYQFNGWYTAKTDGDKVYNADGSCVKGTAYFDSNGNSLCVNDLTVYAHWTRVTYNIYYTLFGSTASVKRTYDATTNTFTLPTPNLSGYTFKGWTGGVDKNDALSNNDSSDPASLRKTVTIDKGSFGDYFFRAIFEKNHSFSDGINVDNVYITQSAPKETFYKINSYRISYNLDGGGDQ